MHEESPDISAHSQSLAMPEKLTKEWVAANRIPPVRRESDLVLDMTRTRLLDSAGAALVHLLDRECRRAGSRLVLQGIDRKVQATLASWTKDMPGEEPEAEALPGAALVALGEQGLAFAREVTTALSVLAEILYWGTFGLLKRRDYRRGVLGEQMYQLGYKAIGVTVSLAFLIGIVLSIQSALQLRQFGADVFLVAMVVWGMIREIGPLMTAIILAARSGSATTAEIATMGVQEEIDALRTMGLNHIQFVVVPKFWAISLTMPVLSLLSTTFGIVGGFAVSMFYLDLSPALFWSELTKNVILKDFVISFIKSIVFAWLIIWIGAYYGFKVKGGAEEVGRATTASVVTALFVIIIADAIFSFVYNIKF
ncbi:MAG: MlaE family lipid ABC transporter permease subunit [Chitinivibrionales bacterium]|nr:MlaE family lipid ABC transporter permease subunit [Chitinivibrionales bacterium]MBD3394655.1 MlaE family lipid ABC transporter permease subunit [Chitinivibrionales bacterium]